MKKDFDNWNNEKKFLDNKNFRPYFYEKEIWFSSMWENVWFEENWKWKKALRPVLILRKFNKEIFLWIPLTSQKKEWKFYYSVKNKNWDENFLLLSQIRLFDAKRLKHIIWKISQEDFQKIKQKTTDLING